MDLDLRGRTALVTGASMGIGRAIACALGREGVRLALVARRGALLDAVSSEIVARGGAKPVAIVQDIMTPSAARDLRERAVAALGSVAILVNCAGGSRPLALDAGSEAWDEAMTLNFTRPRELAHAFLPEMIAGRWGRIINISGKSEPFRLNAAFAAKAAVHAWAKGLSRDVGRYNVTVNSIAPGRIMSEQIRRNYPEAERARFAAAEIPLGRYGEPEELAALAVFLASPLASYISGTVIPVDGGLRRYSF